MISFEDFSKEEKEKLKAIIKLKTYDATKTTEMGKMLVDFVSQITGKRHEMDEKLRKLSHEFVSSLDYKKINELLNVSKGYGVEVELRNIINPRIKEFWDIYYYFHVESDDDLGKLLGGEW